jgi:hypothetical protein
VRLIGECLCEQPKGCELVSPDDYERLYFRQNVLSDRTFVAA